MVLLLAGGALACYALVLAFLWWRQESLLFYPVPLPADHRLAHAPDVQELQVDVPGARLSVLHLQRPGARGVVFFLHGNAGNLQGWFSNADFYRDAGYDLVMPDYRGFGKSTGRIGSASELREDVRAVWTHVAPQYRASLRRRVSGRPQLPQSCSFGRALGCSSCLDTLRSRRPAASQSGARQYCRGQTLKKARSQRAH